MARVLCMAIGYLCGNFLTAEAVARGKTGKSARDLGTGNPGMANVTAQLGIGWGLLVLLGDIFKTALACLLCRVLLFPELGALAVFYSGVGAVLGHNFPAWKKFRGGKGVAVTCTFLVLAAPLWGTLSCLAGLLTVVLTGYLPLGAVLIPALFIVPAFAAYGWEAGILAVLTALLMLSRHYRGLLRVARGEEERKLRRKPT